MKEKLRLLHITPQAPGEFSGGEIGVAQTIKSISGNLTTVDYIGPKLANKEYKNYYQNVYELEPTKNLILLMLNLLKGITNSRYNAWMKLKIDFNKYDFVVIDFTKQNYILKRINKSKLIVRIHNVEFDYSKKDYDSRKNLKNYIVMKLAKKQEREFYLNARHIVVLSEIDKERLENLYGKRNDVSIVPVCVEKKTTQNNKTGKCIKLLITGSLWFGENNKGIIWFMKNVCPNLKLNYRLTIAGSNPTDELINEINKNENIDLIVNPEKIEDYFNYADIVIVPIFNGAGMKVKVAEALSYSKPIIGTSHAFIGYKVKNGENSFEANDVQSFVDQIEKITLLNEEDKLNLTKLIGNFFEENYSLRISKNKWIEIMNSNKLYSIDSGEL